MDQKNLLTQALGLIRNQRQHRWWLRVMTGMAAVVVFVTTYLLILPAITVENSIFELTAALPEAVPGETIQTEIYAEADDGREKTYSIEFSFRVERWDDQNGWTQVDIVQNFKGDILFRETFSEAGTYYYRVSEINGGGAYQYDTTQYIVKIDVTAIQGNILQAEQTYYKAAEVSEVENGQPVDKITFQNTTSTEEPGYVLPETGGAGTTIYTAGGLALMALAGLMYRILRRKGEDAS